MSGDKLVWRVWTRMTLIYVIANILLRIALCLHPLTGASSLSVLQWIEVFVVGAINDACIISIMTVPLYAFLMSSGHWKLHKPQCWMLLGALVCLWLWVAFGWSTLHEFNKPFARILGYVVLYWIATFALRTFVPAVRQPWMTTWTAIILLIYMLLLTMNICGEWLFWNEFGVRYNFIAVDYLIYTTEVVGNIMQSYSMGWIIAAVVIIALALEFLLFRNVIIDAIWLYKTRWRLKGSTVYIPALVGLCILPLTHKLQDGDNVWCNELQAAGPYSFVMAFMDNKLDYNEFYLTVSDDTMDQIMRETLAMPPDSTATDSLRPNIVLVTLESMSASYMERFGGTNHLTPTLDSLWLHSLAFDNMFAAGNRTVRGLEALTLSRPPSAGESIIKREVNTGYPSIADKLKEMGYTCTFYYGGDSYFDNMESFSTGLGYKIKDRKTMADEDITCQTIWGVCDGDVFKRVINDMDSAYSAGQPTFTHIMTTSNHRPYIYPDGCISIPPTKKSRNGGVMYSDYALGQFLNEASKRPWHEKTIYVIVADHCASSAGSTELPLGNYHIPAIIYSPSLIEPQIVETTASQIDIMPTLFGRLHWTSAPSLYGRDILSPDYKDRALIATYQDLGYYANDTLTILSPGRKVRQAVLSPTADDPYNTTSINIADSTLIIKAAAIYQSASR